MFKTIRSFFRHFVNGLEDDFARLIVGILRMPPATPVPTQVEEQATPVEAAPTPAPAKQKIPGRWTFSSKPDNKEFFVAGRNSSCGIKAGEKVMIVSYALLGGSEELSNVTLRNQAGTRLFDLPEEDTTWRFVMADA